MASFKSIRRQWHKTMRPRAAFAADEQCQRCKCITQASDGIIHHTEYPLGCYTFDVEPLMRCGVCQWLCLDCHGKIHGDLVYQHKRERIVPALEEHRRLDRQAVACFERDRS